MKKGGIIGWLFVLFVAMFFIIFLSPAIFYGEPWWSRGEQPLGGLPPVGEYEEIDKERCGDYFLYGNSDNNPEQKLQRQLSFGFKKRFDDILKVTVSPKYFKIVEVVIEEDYSIPTAELFWGYVYNEDGEEDGEVCKKIILRMSESQYERSSSCLPKPKQKTEKLRNFN